MRAQVVRVRVLARVIMQSFLESFFCVRTSCVLFGNDDASFALLEDLHVNYFVLRAYCSTLQQYSHDTLRSDVNQVQLSKITSPVLVLKLFRRESVVVGVTHAWSSEVPGVAIIPPTQFSAMLACFSFWLMLPS